MQVKTVQNVQMPDLSPVSEVEVVESFLTENYELRNNVLSHKMEVRDRQGDHTEKFRPLTREAMNSIIIAARKELAEIKNPKPLITELIQSEGTPNYDPIKEYLESLPAWDGQERVDALFRCLPGVDDQHVCWLHTWLRSAVAHWLDLDMLHGNECAPVLIGHQGVQKSAFCRRILPEHLRTYYLDHINLANKFDKEMALTHNLLVNIDELDQVKPKQQAELKQTLTKVNVNGRPIYGRAQRDDKRYASFIATTNCRTPLQDPTGSRRYICIEIPDGQLIDNETEIDYDQLYAQLLHELRVEKRRYWFTNEETLQIQKANEPYQREVTIEEIVNTCFRKPDESEQITPIPLADMITHMSKSFPEIKITHGLRINVARELLAQGYKHKKVHSVALYFAVCA